MRADLAWRGAVVAVLLVAGACGSGAGDADGDGPGGLRKLPVGAAGAGRSSATMSAEAADSSAAMIAPAQAIEYRVADGADDVPDTATAYEVTPFPTDEVRAKVAEALEVDPERIEVGVGGYEWYFSGAASPDTAVSSPAASSPACAPDEKCVDPSATSAPPPTVPGVPSEAEAEDRARRLLEAINVDLDGRFEVFGEDGFNRTVQFTPSVDGVPVAGLQTQIAFGGDARIEYANGVLADIEAIGEYPLVALDEAVQRLQEGFGAGGDIHTTGAPEPATDPASSGAGSGGGGSAGASGSAPADPEAPTSDGAGDASSGSGSAPATDDPCAEGEPCSSPPSPPTDEPTMTIEPDRSTPTVPLEPTVIEITGADLSLQLVAAGCPGDPVYLVPTFVLQPDDAATVIAVEDDAVSGGGDVPVDAQPCPELPTRDLPAGRPEPAPRPADAGREPATP